MSFVNSKNVVFIVLYVQNKCTVHNSNTLFIRTDIPTLI